MINAYPANGRSTPGGGFVVHTYQYRQVGSGMLSSSISWVDGNGERRPLVCFQSELHIIRCADTSGSTLVEFRECHAAYR